MATTDTKPGFRLPWSPDRTDGVDSTEDPATGPTEVQETETTDMLDAAPAAPDNEAAAEPIGEASPAPIDTVADSAAQPTAAPASASPARKPNKLMADLTRAMQSAAEQARTDTLERFGAEAKTHVEGIHATSAEEATALRKQADDDVAAIRDWSKAEIARIREETDERIAHRKTTLEHEIEEHAAAIERRIERVQARVAAFEGEMAAFFERLLAEDDPTRLAAMAESLPEPPAFDAEWENAPIAAAPKPEPEPVVEAVAETAPDVAPDATADVVADGPTGWESSETFEAAEPVAEVVAETVADTAPADDGDLFSIGADPASDGDDPRIAALGLSADFAAAEAEAAVFEDDGSAGDDEIPVIADDALAARIAGLVGATDETESETNVTRLIVTGLVSVASIAGFKRHLSRANGVSAVGVSSGPDGEFVFAVTHDPSINLRDVVAVLPGFAARVTAEAEGQLTVAATDPETEH